MLLGNARAQAHVDADACTSGSSTGSRRAATSTAALEFLPTDAEIDAAARTTALGLTVAGARRCCWPTPRSCSTRRAARDSTCPTTRTSSATLRRYFPTADARAATPTQLDGHPLRREIITTQVVNDLVNRGGITFVFRLAGGDRRHARARSPGRLRGRREIFGLGRLRATRSRRSTTSSPPRRRPRLLPRVPPPARPRRRAGCSPTGAPPLDIGAEIEHFSGVVRELRAAGARAAARRASRRRARARRDELVRAGRARGPRACGRRRCSTAYSLLDIVEIADRHRPRPDRGGAACTSLVSERFGLDAMLGQDHRACRATTAGTPWPAARCATTSTRCSSR